MRSRSTSVKPLSPAEVREENVDALFLVWLVSRSAHDLLDATLAPAGLTGDEFALYSVLNAAGHITPTDLARWMAAPPTTVSSYVKRLESRGHVTREPNPADRRSYQVRLTPAGRKAHKVASRLFQPVRDQVVHAFGAEAEPLRETLLRLRTALDDLRHEPQS